MSNYEPFMHPGPPHPPWNDGHHHGPYHPGEPHEHAHWHPWGDVLASGECDDQLPLFSHVGRGLKGDSFRVDLREPNEFETYLDGVSIDSNTGLETPAWTTDNLNAGKLTNDKITDPNDLDGLEDPWGITPDMLPANHYGYLMKYFKHPGDAPTWVKFIGPFPNDAQGYELNVHDEGTDRDGTPLPEGAFKIHIWTTKPDGTREYDKNYSYYEDYWSPTIYTDDAKSLPRFPVYDVIIKNPDDANWEPDDITTESEWADPTYDHPGTQRKNTYPDSWDDPEKISDLPAPGDPGIVTIEVGPHKDVDVYTTPQMDNATGYGDKMPDLITLPGDYEGDDGKPYAWNNIPSGWTGSPIQYITHYEQGDHPAGSTNYSPNIAAYDQARFDDLAAGIAGNTAAIAAWAQSAVNNWKHLPLYYKNSFKQWYLYGVWFGEHITNRSMINEDLGLIYFDIDWELPSNKHVTRNTTLATFSYVDNNPNTPASEHDDPISIDLTPKTDNHSIGNMGHRIKTYSGSEIPPQYYNDFPVLVSGDDDPLVAFALKAPNWQYDETGETGAFDATYLHIVGMVPIAVIKA